MTTLTKFIFGGAAVLVLAALVVWFVNPMHKTSDPLVERLRGLTDIAERACLVNTSDQQSARILAELKATATSVGGTADVQKRQDVMRGAAQKLSEDVQRMENTAVRDCMRPLIEEFTKLAAHRAALPEGGAPAAPVAAAGAPSPTDAALARLKEVEELYRKSMDSAERICLSQVNETEKRAIVAKFNALRNGLGAGADIGRRASVARGASQDLPAAWQLTENREIRECMKNVLKPISGMAELVVGTAAAADSPFPDPINFRFYFAPRVRKPVDIVRLELNRTRKPPLSVGRLTYQIDTGGQRYYQYPIPYPAVSETIAGTLIRAVDSDGRLTAEPAVLTQVCFTRPGSFPPAHSDYDLFECSEGAMCKPHRMSTRWLDGCTQVPSLPSSMWLAALGVPNMAEARGAAGAGPEGRAAPRWVVPSLQSLLKRNVEGVGFSIITFKTDAFRNRDITAVEVDVRVNDVPVHEDGLPPEHRRAANYPDAPFGHSFALQTLNFLGARGGCDVIRLALTPAFADGRRGETRVAQLSYVALRDVAERTVPLGTSELKWTASYATPAREWRHVPFLHSYIFRPSGGEAAIAAATQAAEKHKTWLDQLNLSYEGKRIVGVIRPPRTIQPDGTAAFGLAAGLIQENGQVRFTFSEPEARKLGEFVRARRARLPGGASIIETYNYVFQAVGGSRTVPGVCDRA